MTIWHETKARSILKTLTMKLLEILTSSLICYLIFGDILIALGLPILLEGIQTILYFIHERMWSLISWGEKKCKDCHFKKYHEKRKKAGLHHD